MKAVLAIAGTGAAIVALLGIMMLSSPIKTVSASGFSPGENITVYFTWHYGVAKIGQADDNGTFTVNYDISEPDRGQKIVSFVGQQSMHVVNIKVK